MDLVRSRYYRVTVRWHVQLLRSNPTPEQNDPTWALSRVGNWTATILRSASTPLAITVLASSPSGGGTVPGAGTAGDKAATGPRPLSPTYPTRLRRTGGPPRRGRCVDGHKAVTNTPLTPDKLRWRRGGAKADTASVTVEDVTTLTPRPCPRPHFIN